jgi:hypothetical protein
MKWTLHAFFSLTNRIEDSLMFENFNITDKTIAFKKKVSHLFFRGAGFFTALPMTCPRKKNPITARCRKQTGQAAVTLLPTHSPRVAMVEAQSQA